MATRTVGADKTYQTIAAAFAASSAGDEIVIDAGTYIETTVLRQNKTGSGTITFKSASGLRDVVWQPGPISALRVFTERYYS